MTSIAKQCRSTRLIGSLATLSALLVFAGCKSLDVENLNGISVDGLQTSPTPTAVNAAAQSLLSAWRSTSGGQAQTLTKYGFEHWQIRASEPRTLSNIVRDNQTGSFWSYGSIKNVYVLLQAVDAVTGMTDQQKDGIRGWAKTILAVLYEDNAQAHDTFGIVIDLPANPATEIPPIAAKAQVWAKIFQLLDEANTSLGNAGTAFSFRLTSGFTGFSTPATFRQVNRALKARYQVLQNDYSGALTSLGGSFLDASAAGLTAAGLRRGPYHVYTTATGDVTNTLSSADRYSNTRIRSEAQCAVPADCAASARTAGDARAFGATAKVRTVTSFTFGGVTTDLKHTDFLSPSQSVTIGTTSPLPIIRNEELILLRAEANLGLGNNSLAIADINRIRTSSLAGLPAITDPYVANAALGQPAALLNELLYEKRYSLWGETGTVWLDMRHYGKILEIPRYDPTFKLWDIFPLPTTECEIRGYTTRGCFLGGLAGK